MKIYHVPNFRNIILTFFVCRRRVHRRPPTPSRAFECSTKLATCSRQEAGSNPEEIFPHSPYSPGQINIAWTKFNTRFHPICALGTLKKRGEEMGQWKIDSPTSRRWGKFERFPLDPFRLRAPWNLEWLQQTGKRLWLSSHRHERRRAAARSLVPVSVWWTCATPRLEPIGHSAPFPANHDKVQLINQTTSASPISANGPLKATV